MKRNYFSVLFFIKKTKLLKNGEAPICMRITVNGKRAEVQIKRSIDIKKWNAKKECAKGSDKKEQELNHYLDTVRTRVLQIHRKLEIDGKPITAEVIKRKFYGENDAPKMLLEVFDEHNRKCRKLLGKDYVLGSILRFERTARYLKEFLKKEYNLSDIPFKEINQAFITNFEHFIRSEKNCAQNATVKYLKIIKRIIKQALVNKWMDTDPYIGVHLWQTKTNRDFLLEEEIILLLNKHFPIERLEIVKDIFVFSSFTGLAFTDVQHLTPNHIICDNNGEYWICKAREKTDSMCNIPLLDVPIQLLHKYENHICRQSNKLFPVPSNQKTNAYLKEIADLCGIKKNLTFHLARHSFACLALANKVSIESIAKMLGHTDIRTTKIYAKVLDRTISDEMQVLKQKFAYN